MPHLTFGEVESWLDTHNEKAADYFIRKCDLDLINRWLMVHGFLTIKEYVHSRRGSTNSRRNSSLGTDETRSSGYLSDGGDLPLRSRKHLRQDYAKNRLINRTCELSPEPRRVRDLRKAVSLPSRSIHILNLLIESKVQIPRPTSKGLEFKREQRYSNEKQFFLSIVQEISNDFDMKSLTSKIIINLSLLMDADGASLFLVEKRKSRQVLVSKVFDVHCGANIFLPSPNDANEIQVPWGKGIIGYVARTGETVNLVNANQDPRYNDEVDRITGYRADTLLCMAIRNDSGETIAVAQVINKNCDLCDVFTKEDEKLMETYLQFCGTAISNAQLFEASRKEYERNRALLEVVHDLFEEQTSLEKIVLKIMQRAQRLLKCERAAVLLLQEDEGTIKFSKTFDLTSPSPYRHSRRWPELQTSPGLLRLAEKVAMTGEVINLKNPLSDNQQGFSKHLRSILCMPIRKRDYKIIGVAISVNRLDGLPFDENDEQLFEAFTLFCGLGITNARMYAELERASARQKVAIEVISYHGTAQNQEIQKFLNAYVPAAEELHLTSLKFDDFSLNTDEMILASVRMFQDLGLLSRFKIDTKTLCQWLCTVRKNYRNVPYHNWRHAFNVTQTMFAIMTQCGMRPILSDLECLAMMVACICHDLDHRGTNNSFQEKSGSPLALLYGNKATMELHHFNHAVMILTSQGHNILSTLNQVHYTLVMHVLKQCILATDLSTYFQNRAKFFSLVDSGQVDWRIDEQRELLRSMLMTACDLAASTKHWPIQQKVAELVTSEFFDQGDKEKAQLKIQPQALMDRDRQNELPELQYRWIDTICLPLYKALAKVHMKFSEMVESGQMNRDKWATLSSQSDRTRNFINRKEITM